MLKFFYYLYERAVLPYWEWLLKIIFPAFCQGCKKEGAFFCQSCWLKIPRLTNQTCPECHKKSVNGEYCGTCKNNRASALDGLLVVSSDVTTSFSENHLLKKAIYALKYSFIIDLIDPLGLLFAETLQRHPFKNALLCSVPLHKKRLKWRGFNQAELLAQKLNKHVKIPVVQLLQRVSFEKPQMELNRTERLKNMINAFIIDEKNFQKWKKDMQERAPIGGYTMVIIDDIATTLSTLEACAKTLKSVGIAKVYGLVLSRG